LNNKDILIADLKQKLLETQNQLEKALLEQKSARYASESNYMDLLLMSDLSTFDENYSQLKDHFSEALC